VTKDTLSDYALVRRFKVLNRRTRLAISLKLGDTRFTK
jgi:hypothetical protein